MKRILSIALACAIALVGLTAQPALAACGLTGAGTDDSPYLVANAFNLSQVGPGGCDSGTHVNQHYKLTADIALSGFWVPGNLEGISTDTATFDGNGKTISGLQVSDGSGFGGDNSGLFGYMNFARVSNLNISGTYVFGRNLVGALVGDATNLSVSSVKVTMTANVAGGLNLGDGNNVGGLVGRLGATSTIEDSYFKSTAAVVGQNGTGGIVGRALDSATLRNVGASTTINGVYNAGGIAGVFKPTGGIQTIDSAFYSGTLTATQNVGGLIGYADAYSASTLLISNSGVRGAIKTIGSSYLPATFVGYADTNVSTVTASNSYATGRYQSNTNTAAADINPVIPVGGTAAYVMQSTVFETTAGVTQTAFFTSTTAAFNTAAAIPSAWTLWVRDHNYRINGVNWVIDIAGTLNNNRPMPARVYNTGFFGTIDFSCLPGTFSATGLAPCDPSAAGTFAATYGLHAAVQCPAGTFASFSGMTYCIDAPIGSFVNALGAAFATPCAPGTTTYVARSVACVAVPAAARYDGPLIKSVQQRTFAGDTVSLSGSNLTGISAVKIDSTNVVFEVRDSETLVLHIPTSATLGVKALILNSSSGNITIDGALLITDKPVVFAVSFIRSKNKVTTKIASPSSVLVKLNGKEVAYQRGSGNLTKLLSLKIGKNLVDVYQDGVLKQRALFTVKK